jgi:histidine triad (HIT) family protein
MNNCLFCKIIAKKIPAKIEYEDKDIIVFDDINAKAPVHLLIVPKKHLVNINNFSESDKDLAGKIFLIAKKMAKKFDIFNSGYRLIINNGLNAGQEVNHLHIHLLGGKKLKF